MEEEQDSLDQLVTSPEPMDTTTAALEDIEGFVIPELPRGKCGGVPGCAKSRKKGYIIDHLKFEIRRSTPWAPGVHLVRPNLR